MDRKEWPKTVLELFLLFRPMRRDRKFRNSKKFFKAPTFFSRGMRGVLRSWHQCTGWVLMLTTKTAKLYSSNAPCMNSETWERFTLRLFDSCSSALRAIVLLVKSCKAYSHYSVGETWILGSPVKVICFVAFARSQHLGTPSKKIFACAATLERLWKFPTAIRIQNIRNKRHVLYEMSFCGQNTEIISIWIICIDTILIHSP